jgi:hypothetical protein
VGGQASGGKVGFRGILLPLKLHLSQGSAVFVRAPPQGSIACGVVDSAGHHCAVLEPRWAGADSVSRTTMHVSTSVAGGLAAGAWVAVLAGGNSGDSGCCSLATLELETEGASSSAGTSGTRLRVYSADGILYRCVDTIRHR